MTVEDVLKAIGGSVLAVMVGVVSWLTKTVLGNREMNLLQGKELETVRERLNYIEARQITAEQVREAIQEAFARRDKVYDRHRVEMNRLQTLEIAEIIRIELKKALEGKEQE